MTSGCVSTLHIPGTLLTVRHPIGDPDHKVFEELLMGIAREGVS